LYTAGGTHDKQSTWMSESKTFPGWECARELGIPVCVSLRPEGLPHLAVLIKQFPQVRIIVDHMMEPPIAEGPPYGGSEFVFDLARYGNVYLKLTTLNIRASRKDKGSPETFFPLLVKKFWRFPHRVGFKLSVCARDTERDSHRSEVGTCGSAGAGSGMDSCPYGSVSVSRP